MKDELTVRLLFRKSRISWYGTRIDRKISARDILGSNEINTTKARPAKSGKKFTGPKLGLNGGCFAIVSYIQDQLDETHRLANFGQLWKNHPQNRQAGGRPTEAFFKNLYTFLGSLRSIFGQRFLKKRKKKLY